MKLPVLAIVAACLAGCATSASNSVDPKLRMANAALAAGEMELAEYYLEDMVEESRDRPDVLGTLTQVYWQAGKDERLLDFADQHLSDEDRAYWWCRVLERRGQFVKAATCWDGLGENARAERSVREALSLELLAPPKTGFGLRRENPGQ